MFLELNTVSHFGTNPVTVNTDTITYFQSGSSGSTILYIIGSSPGNMMQSISVSESYDEIKQMLQEAGKVFSPSRPIAAVNKNVGSPEVL